jgi:AraC-like DNA-binding protein
MRFQNIEHDISLWPFVKSVMIFESGEESAKTTLPFFADGFPGLMYHKTPNGLRVHPHKKLMPELFIYGQTIEPIEIDIFGQYQIIVFQLYPFTLKSLFGIEPKSINDNCYDLTHNEDYMVGDMLEQLSSNTGSVHKVNAISEFISRLVNARKYNFDPTILKAIEKILITKGRLNLADTAKEMNITKRTFERRFVAETGLLPKQFSKIIQFQSSLTQLTIKDYNILTDVVYEQGYADQSHFIKVFKSFTGKTPRQFIRKQHEQ